MPAMLSRAKRAEITTIVLKKLYPLCKKRKNLFSDKDAEDLMEEVGVHVWVALIRYRRKPYDQALKLAMTTGVNRLTSIVRSKLTVMKRGAGTVTRPGNPEDTYWMVNHSIQANGVLIIDALESIVSAAITRVGVNRASALIQALMYDWKHKPKKQQLPIMLTLKRDRRQVRKLVNSFSKQVQSELPYGSYAPYSNLLQKIDGTWKSNR